MIGWIARTFRRNEPVEAPPKVEWQWWHQRLISQDRWAIFVVEYHWNDEHTGIKETYFWDGAGNRRQYSPFDTIEPAMVLPGPVWKLITSQPAWDPNTDIAFLNANDAFAEVLDHRLPYSAMTKTVTPPRSAR